MPLFEQIAPNNNSSQNTSQFNTVFIIGILISLGLYIIGVGIYQTLYYFSLEYEILDKEIHVFGGVLTQTLNVIPLRTVTNIDIRRGIVEQLVGIGSIEIHTASSTIVKNKRFPAGKMEGLPKNTLEDLHKRIIDRVRNVTKAKIEGKSESTTSPEESIKQKEILLKEMKNLKKLLKNTFPSK